MHTCLRLGYTSTIIGLDVPECLKLKIDYYSDAVNNPFEGIVYAYLGLKSETRNVDNNQPK